MMYGETGSAFTAPMLPRNRVPRALRRSDRRRTYGRPAGAWPGRARETRPERYYDLMPSVARASLAAFSASACLPAAWRALDWAAATFAAEAVASYRLAVASCSCLTSFGHWKAEAGAANTRAIRAAIAVRASVFIEILPL